MFFFNLIKFRKLFLILIWLTIIYFIKRFIYLSRSLDTNLNTKQFNLVKKSEFNHNKLIRKPYDKILFSEHIRIARYEENCGTNLKCNENEFSLFINTGYQNSILPQLCIDNKFLSNRNFNRGLNVVTIDNVTKTVINLQNFDTYSKDSTNFETLLLSLRPGDKIILFTFDETIAKLSKVAKLLLHEFGSYHIQNLQFRTAWYLISEKQIKGYSPFEDIHLPIAGKWATPFNVNFCIPFEIKGHFVKVDQSLYTNKARIKYCKQFKDKSNYGFCNDNVINDELYLNPIQTTITNNLIDNTPILVFLDPDSDNDLLSLLETLFRQQGILSINIFIFYYEKSSNEIKSLTELFSFKSFEINLNLNIINQIKYKIINNYPNSKQFILIFGNLILTADFLNYFAQLIPSFWIVNSNLSFISAWNDNCQLNMCNDDRLIYRIKGNRFSLKHCLAIKFDYNFFNLLDRLIKLNNFNNQSISFDDLMIDGLIPDFPRIIVTKEVSDIFLNENNEKKMNSLFENVKINQIETIETIDNYKKSIIDFQNNSILIKDEESLINFLENHHNKSINLTIFTNLTTSDKICTIFNLKNQPFNYYLNNIGNLFRFNYNKLNILLIKLL